MKALIFATALVALAGIGTARAENPALCHLQNQTVTNDCETARGNSERSFPGKADTSKPDGKPDDGGNKGNADGDGKGRDGKAD